MTAADVDARLARPRGALTAPTGSWRAKGISGKDIGPFRYYGTRPDDPNDIYPHEHRRELRGMRVFAAWLNHDDSRSINTLDFLHDASRHSSCGIT